MDERTFEDAIAELFRRLGYRVEQTPYSNDGGKDAIAWRDEKKYVIECKRYMESGVTGRRDLQILLAAMHDEAADGAFFISTGRFSATAIKYGRANGIELYDHTHLPILINRAYGPSAALPPAQVICPKCGAIVLVEIAANGYNQVTCPQSHIVASNICLSDLSVAVPLDTPACPKCSAPMKMVKGRNGNFWGCSRYPQCRSTISMRKLRYAGYPGSRL
jgi:ssDNA-binding Zn-finger/Zn-ribbon topoisomerase 1